MCLPAAEVRPVGLARAARPPPAWGWGSSAHLLVGALSHPSFSRPTDRATDRTLRLSSPSRLPALARPGRPRTPPVREGRRDHGEPAFRLVDHYFTLSSDVTPRWRSWANRSSSVRPHRCSSRWHSRPSRTRSRTRWSTSAANRRLNRGTLTRRARPVGRRATAPAATLWVDAIAVRPTTAPTATAATKSVVDHWASVRRSLSRSPVSTPWHTSARLCQPCSTARRDH